MEFRGGKTKRDLPASSAIVILSTVGFAMAESYCEENWPMDLFLQNKSAKELSMVLIMQSYVCNYFILFY